ncbi:MAG TPA: CcoQ/FixQ family Cbb3-type cytochrome c oxidase assembly chaperone [Woeseiaceae bacterium]|jgi:cytochrome c oxidase cbb3-type subunit 4|nr:CcoQ/FixQ family Cbb3-type cytochrome c oxidase assembly chaperone [Woeseiaceae bacterium]
MDIGTIRGLITAVLLLLFIGLWITTWSRKRRASFDEASRLPLVEDEESRSTDGSNGRGEGGK